MSKYKHIIFDIDGTLIDTEYAVLHSLQETLLLLGKKYSIKELSFALGITGEDALKQLEICNIDKTLDIWDKNMDKYREKIILFDGIKDILLVLVKKGYKLGIITSKTKGEFNSDFDDFGITNLFETIICADDSLKHKPNPEPMLKYIEVSNIRPEEALYIGDSQYDAICSKSANVDFGLAVWGHKKKDVFADYYFNIPEDILEVLK